MTDENHKISDADNMIPTIADNMIPTICNTESDSHAQNNISPFQKKSRNGRCLKPKIFLSPSTADPSRIVLDSPTSPVCANDISEEYEEDGDICCVCKQKVPLQKNKTFVQIISWAQCINVLCKHWVHLKYCHSLTVVQNSDVFYCPCCESEQ